MEKDIVKLLRKWFRDEYKTSNFYEPNPEKVAELIYLLNYSTLI